MRRDVTVSREGEGGDWKAVKGGMEKLGGSLREV